MAAQALDSGAIVVQGDGVDTSIDFGMPADHKVTLLTTDRWSDAASKPDEDLRTWCNKVSKDSGLVPNVCVMGVDAWGAFVDHARIKDKLDNRRIEAGKIDPMQLPDGVTYCGTFRDSGVFLDIYTYNSYYVDDQGNDQPFVKVDKVLLGSSRAQNKRLYGAIQDLKAGNIKTRRFFKSWETEDPSVRWILGQSAPLVAMLQPDAFLSATVL